MSLVWTHCESGAVITGRLTLAATVRFQMVDLFKAPDAVSLGTGRVRCNMKSVRWPLFSLVKEPTTLFV